MSLEKFLKDFLIFQIKQKLDKIKQEIKRFDNPPPDLVILSYGIVIGYMDIVTEKEISSERINRWKELIYAKNKLIIIIPKEEKLKIMEILWKEGIAEKVSIGTYEVNISLP
ncbi:MAG: hypothetical protein RMI30_04145 [Thermodesulfovibrio sp.]|nr:hypothetical protein [Thermodesulfovibrio sp.]MDW7998626.1 hypothetical protein [Thermodesulfovibrio sp.]